MVSNGNRTVTDKLIGMWNEAVITCFKVVPEHFEGRTDENNLNPWLV
jgi:hypothetical protein